MTSPSLVSAVLLVLCTIACANKEYDKVVVTTSEVTEEIRCELNMAELCSGGSQNCTSLCEDSIAEIEKRLTDSIRAVVNSTIRDALQDRQPQMFNLGLTSNLPAASCKEILQQAPQSPSGLYWIRGTDNRPRQMYCDMERSCKGVAGGWMRVASIDMNETNSTCPSGLRTLTSPRRLCAMNINGGGCSSAVLPVQGVDYSQVCGKIIGYQDKSPDAFRGAGGAIDASYVDGISLTYGTSPRKHIWTFAAALHEFNSARALVCPCTNTRNSPPPAVPSFVGNDYFCDTGSEEHFQYIFYGEDPLWDGAGCGEFNTCCSWNSPPWFRKELTTPTNDDIEIRLCADEARGNEDITFESLEIYVQ